MVHVYFSSEEYRYRNIKVILPFDRTHVEAAFTVDKTSHATDYINKTFDVVFEVSAPIMHEWKKFFRDIWSSCIKPVDDEELEVIIQIIDSCCRFSDITPRTLINIVNECVSKKRLNPHVQDRYVVLYVLSKIEAKCSVDNLIGGYTKENSNFTKVRSLIEEEAYLKNMTALIYQIEPDNAMDFILKQRLRDSIIHNDKDIFISICKSKILGDIILSAVNDLPYDAIPNAVRLFDLLFNTSSIDLDSSKKKSVWKCLKNKYLIKNDENVVVPDWELLLLKNLDDLQSRKETAQHITRQFSKVEPNTSKSYVEVYDMLESCNVDESILKTWKNELNLSIDVLVELISLKSDLYSKYYSQEIDTNAIDSYFINHEEIELNKKCKAIEVLKEKEGCSFKNYIKHLESMVSSTEFKVERRMQSICILAELDDLPYIASHGILEIDSLYATAQNVGYENAVSIVDSMYLYNLAYGKISFSNISNVISGIKDKEKVAKYYIALNKGKNLFTLLVCAKNTSSPQINGILSYIFNYEEIPGVLKKDEIVSLINDYDKYREIINSKSLLSYISSTNWEKDGVLPLVLKPTCSVNFYVDSNENIEIPLCASVIHAFKEKMKKLTEDGFMTAVVTLSDSFIDAAIRINYIDYEQKHVYGIKKYLLDNAGRIDNNVWNARIKPVVDNMAKNVGLTLNAIFGPLLEKYARNVIVPENEFLYLGDYILKYNAFDYPDPEMRILFAPSILKQESCVRIMENNINKIISLYNKCTDDGKKEMRNILENSNSPLWKLINDRLG